MQLGGVTGDADGGVVGALSHRTLHLVCSRGMEGDNERE